MDLPWPLKVIVYILFFLLCLGGLAFVVLIPIALVCDLHKGLKSIADGTLDETLLK